MIILFITIDSMEEKHMMLLLCFVSGVGNKEKGKWIAVKKLPKV